MLNYQREQDLEKGTGMIMESRLLYGQGAEEKG